MPCVSKKRFVGTNVIRQVANVLAGLVISALKGKPVETGSRDGNGGREGVVTMTNEGNEGEAH